MRIFTNLHFLAPVRHRNKGEMTNFIPDRPTCVDHYTAR